MLKISQYNILQKKTLVSVLLCTLLLIPCYVTAQESVELNGDTIEYSVEGNKVIAKGNVDIRYRGSLLTADEVEFDRDTQVAYAVGNVTLITDSGEISGEKIEFDFNSMTGSFNNAHIMAHPYYGYARKVHRVDDNHLVLEDGYITTSDYDKPGYRVVSKKIDVYPGDKLVAKHVKLKLAGIPVFYSPVYRHNISDQEPRFVFLPGYDSDWGAFLLSTFNHRFNDQVKIALHADYRNHLGTGGGADVFYNTDSFGDGLIRTYYTGEEDKNFVIPVKRDRYKVEWRHKWKIDDKTNAIWQFYKLSGPDFLKDYFEEEYDDDGNPGSFFVLTHALSKGILSLRSDVRVNRFEGKVERLPEIKYTLNSEEIFDTGFYLKNTTTYSNLIKKSASPSSGDQKTFRIDTDSEISYPTKIGFIEFKPFVGGRFQHYSSALDGRDDGSIRGIFKTGASVSTKFYRVFDMRDSFFGEDVTKMRHIITPSINYLYQDDPTFANNKVNQFDSIDNLSNAHSVGLSLENKLQIKKGDNTIELLRAVVSSPFKFKESASAGGFDVVKVDVDVKPLDWLSFYFDSKYDPHDRQLDEANFDTYINGNTWRLGIGRRFNDLSDDQITLDFDWKINAKWAFRIYERLDIESGRLKEQNYLLTRDLHSWKMELNYHDSRGDGSQILMAFRLKAFPELGFDFGESINGRHR